MSDERIFRNICEEYFETKDFENCYEIVGVGKDDIGKVVITNNNEYYRNAYVYASWEELYSNNIKYCIKDDFNDIGEDEVRDYLDDEAYEYVINDLELVQSLQEV